MEKFWKWMESKDYCDRYGFFYWKDPVYGDKNYYPVGNRTQELLGFLEEYLFEVFQVSFGVKSDTREKMRYGKTFAEARFEQYLEAIENEEKKLDKKEIP